MLTRLTTTTMMIDEYDDGVVYDVGKLVEFRCNALKKGREDSDERVEVLSELKSVELRHKELKDELAQYADNDPAAFDAMKNAIEVAYSAANRWTDNVFTLKQWCANNFPQAKEQLESLYQEAGITDEFDYIEVPTLASLGSTDD